MFEEFGPLGNTLILIVSLVVLDKAIDWTVTNALRVADITGLGRTTIGFILVAFCTSLPALSVSIFSAMSAESIGIAIGNALGSNIVNICLILGISLILVAMKKSYNLKSLSSMVKHEIGSLYFGLFVGSIIPLVLIYIGYASRLVGIILLGVFAFYIYWLSTTGSAKEESSSLGRQNIRKHVSFTLLSAGTVVILAYFILNSAFNIATWAGIRPEVIGATVVAFGTSVPILMASLRAVQKGYVDLTLGNIVGTCFMNTTCVLGATLVVSPLRVNMTSFSNLVMFSVIATIFLWYFLSSEAITWKEGAVLLFMYFLFLTISLSGYKT